MCFILTSSPDRKGNTLGAIFQAFSEKYFMGWGSLYCKELKSERGESNPRHELGKRAINQAIVGIYQNN